MVAAGLAWFAPTVGFLIPLGIFWSLSINFGSLYLVLLAQLFVSFPTGTLSPLTVTGNTTIAPGAYGATTVKAGGKLFLTNGTYT